jgi:hypothetical protein
VEIDRSQVLELAEMSGEEVEAHLNQTG